MTRNTHIVLLAALMTSVAAGALVAKHRAEASLSQALAGANINVASISANPITGSVDIEGLSADKLHIGHIILRKAPYNLIGSAQAATGSEVTFDDVTADVGWYHIEVPELVVTGSDLSQDAISALFDPKGTGSLAERVAKFNATSVASQEITVTTDLGEMASETTYSNFKATNIVGGKVAALTIESAESSTNGKKKTSVSTTLGEITATNINLPANVRVLTDKAVGDEPLVPMVDSVVAKNLEIDIEDDKGEGGVFKAATFSYGPVKGRPLKVPFADLMKMASDHKDNAKASPQEMAQMMPAVDDIFQAIEFSAEMKDMSFGPKDDKPGPKGKLARFAITDFGKGGIGSISYEGLSFEAENGHFSLGSFGMKGLVFSPFLTAMTEAAKSNFKNFNPRANMPTIAQISLNGLDVDLPDSKNEGNSADGSRIKLALGKFEINLGNYISGIPSDISTTLDHAAFDLPKGSEDDSVQKLLALGIDKIDASAKLAMAYAEAKQEIALTELSLTGANLGKLTINGSIGNVSKDLFNPDTNVETAAALAAVVKSLDVKLENNGALDKFITLQAKAQGQSPDEFKKGIISMAAVGIPAMLGGNGAAGKTIANAVSKFIADPKNLHIIVTSKDGLGAGDIGLISSPADLLKKVDINAAANE